VCAEELHTSQRCERRLSRIRRGALAAGTQQKQAPCWAAAGLVDANVVNQPLTRHLEMSDANLPAHLMQTFRANVPHRARLSRGGRLQ
jgi:hypothetical protein